MRLCCWDLVAAGVLGRGRGGSHQPRSQEVLRLHKNGLGPFLAVACLTFIERNVVGPGSSLVMGQENGHSGLFSGCYWSFHHELFFTRRRTGRKERRMGGRKEEEETGTVIICILGTFGAFPAYWCHLIFWEPSRLFTIIIISLFRMLANLLKDEHLGKSPPWKPTL